MPTRLAREKKNSKYDDENYLVDYSGQQNKMRKICESGQSTAGKLLIVDASADKLMLQKQSSTQNKKKSTSTKRSKKQAMKDFNRVNTNGNYPYSKLIEENLQIQIQQIKIDKADLTMSKKQPQPSLYPNKYETEQYIG